MRTGETAVQLLLVLVRPMTCAAAAGLIALVLAAFVCTLAKAEPDLWGHVRLSPDTLRDRRLVSIDPYWFTQDTPWVNHECLSEVTQAVAYRAAGVFGLIALKTIHFCAAVTLLAIGIRRAAEPYRRLLFSAGIASRPDRRCHRGGGHRLEQCDSAIELSGDRRHVDARSCRRRAFFKPDRQRPAGPALRLGAACDLAPGATPARFDRWTPRNGVQRKDAPGTGSRRERATQGCRLPRAQAAGVRVAQDASKQRGGILARSERLSTRRADSAIGRRHSRRLAAAPRRDTDAAVPSVSPRRG